jgi:hypothetical protein
MGQRTVISPIDWKAVEPFRCHDVLTDGGPLVTAEVADDGRFHRSRRAIARRAEPRGDRKPVGSINQSVSIGAASTLSVRETSANRASKRAASAKPATLRAATLRSSTAG